jgi:hypothetical protein
LIQECPDAVTRGREGPEAQLWRRSPPEVRRGVIEGDLVASISGTTLRRRLAEDGDPPRSRTVVAGRAMAKYL